MRKGNRCQGPAFDRRRPETDAAVIVPELQQGLIDAQRIGRIGPLIADHAMPEQDPGIPSWQFLGSRAGEAGVERETPEHASRTYSPPR